MSKTNSLTSHHGESSNSRADKMSGMTKGFKKSLVGKSKKDIKKFSSKKRRIFLNSESSIEKI
jgi:hypothetical protein